MDTEHVLTHQEQEQSNAWRIQDIPAFCITLETVSDTVRCSVPARQALSRRGWENPGLTNG